MSQATTLQPSQEVRSALEGCAEEVRVRARNFWYGMRLLPRERFHALCAVYSWMRRADDLADGDVGLDASERGRSLASYRERTHEIFTGVLPGDVPDEERGILLAMRHVVACHELDIADFDLMIDGQCSDLKPRTIETRAELHEYCDQVASTVGRVCVRVWGTGSEEALEMATNRGVAFQLTNILRDLHEDHGRGRVYLPADELDSAGLDIGRLLSWKDPDACGRFIKEQAAVAQELYDLSSGLENAIDPACRPTSWAMTRIYRSLLEKIAHRPRLVSGPGRVRLSSLRKISIALRARRLAWYGQGERGEVIE